MKAILFLLCCVHFSFVNKNREKNLRTHIIAHRGLVSKHLENTREAMIEAFTHGADGVEFDVQMSKDNIPMVTHDLNLKRLCDLEQNINNLNLAELKNIKQKNIYDIPTLEEVLSVIPTGKLVNIELKESVEDSHGAGVRATLQVTKNYKNKLNIIVSSFIPNILMQVHEQDPDLKLAYLIDDDPIKSYLEAKNILSYVDYLNPNINHINNQTAWLIKKLGIKFIFWGHKKLGEEMPVINNGHFGLITDIAEKLSVY